MTDNTQELDEILSEFGYQAIHKTLGIAGLRIEQKEAKQAILDWHNKQIEEAMAKFSLKKGIKYDVKASDSVIVIVPANKLKDAEL